MSDFQNAMGSAINDSIDPAATYDVGEQIRAEKQQAEVDGWYDFDAEMAAANNLTFAQQALPNVAEVAPEILAELSTQPGATQETILTSAEEFDASLDLETWRLLWEDFIEREDNYEKQLEYWNRLPPSVATALRADGVSGPVERHPGGIDIPFTSPFRRLAGAVGLGSGSGNVQVLANTDNRFTQTVDAGLDFADEAVGGLGRNIVSTTFKAVDAADQYMWTRPLSVGQLYNEENGSLIPGVPDSQGYTGTPSESLTPEMFDANAPKAGLFNNFLGLGRALITGDARRLWNLTQDSRNTFRPTAITRAEEILGGDPELLVLAEEFVKAGHNPVKAAEEASGQPEGSPEYQLAYVTLLNQLPTGDQDGTDFTDAVEMLQYNKVSPWHNLAEAGGVGQDHKYHGVTAGLYEFGILAALDPSIVVSNLNRMRRIATHGVKSGHLRGAIRSTDKLKDVARMLDRAPDDPLRIAAAKRLNMTADHVLTRDEVSLLVKQANAEHLGRLDQSKFARALVSDHAQLNKARRVDAMTEAIARVADKGDEAYQWGELMHEVPKSRYMVENLSAAMNDGRIVGGDADSVWRFFDEESGYRALMTGALGRDTRLITLPGAANRPQLWEALGDKAKVAFDMERTMPQAVKNILSDAHKSYWDDTLTFDGYNAARLAADEADPRNAIQKIKDNWFGIRTLGRRAPKHVPRNSYIHVRRGRAPAAVKDANEGILEFERFINTGDIAGFTNDMKRAYLNAFIDGNSAQRREVVKTAAGEMLVRAGVFDSTDEAMDLIRKYGVGLSEHYASLDEIEDLTSSTRSVMASNAGLWSSHLSPQVGIPNFIDLQRASRKVNTTRALVGRKAEQVDHLFSRFWKPTVVLKLGFIARAGGEEALSFALRYGSLSYMRSSLGARWSSTITINPTTGEAVPIRELSPMWKRTAAAGEQLRKWGRSREIDAVTLGFRQYADDAARTQMRVLEATQKAATTQAERTLAGIEIIKFKAPYIDKYMASRSLTSKTTAGMGTAAVKFAGWASPRTYKLTRQAKVIPKRETLAKVFMGETDNAIRGVNRPLSVRPGTIDVSAIGHIKSGVEPGHLVMAQQMMLDQETLARMIANDMGSSWAVYVDDADALRDMARIDTNRLTQKIDFTEHTTWMGRTKYVPMTKPSREWEWVDSVEKAAREAVGFQMIAPSVDPVLHNSGAWQAAHTAIGPKLADDLTNLLGPTWRRQVSDLRDNLSTVGDEDLYAALRQAFIDGGDWPTHPLVPGLDKFADVDNEAINRMRGLLYPDADLLAEPIRDLDEALDVIRQRVEHYTFLPEYRGEVLEQMARVTRTSGIPVVEPIVSNQHRIYGMTVRPHMTDALSSLDLAQKTSITNRFRLAMQKRGVPDEEANRVINLLFGQDPNDYRWIRDVSALNDAAISEFVPASNIMFSNPDLADDVATAFDDALNRIRQDPASQVGSLPMMGQLRDVPPIEDLVSLGYLDVNDSDMAQRISHYGTDSWREATVFSIDDAGLAQTFQRLDPNNHVRFAETVDGTWIDVRQWEAIEAVRRPRLTGQVQLINGQSEWAATKQLTEMRMTDFQNIFIGGESGDMLNEVTGLLYVPGVFEPNRHLDMLDAREFPAKVPAPIRVDHRMLTWDRMVNFGFEAVMAPAIAAIARTPHVTHTMAAQIPFMDEYYHWTTSGTLNDDMLGMFGELGIDDEQLGLLLDEIHGRWRSPDLWPETYYSKELGEYVTETDTNLNRLIRAMSDMEQVTPDEFADRFFRVFASPHDRIHNSKDEVLDALMRDHLEQTGKPPTLFEEQAMDVGLDEVIGRPIPNLPAKETRLEDTRSAIQHNKDEIEHARLQVRANENQQERIIAELDNAPLGAGPQIEEARGLYNPTLHPEPDHPQAAWLDPEKIRYDPVDAGFDNWEDEAIALFDKQQMALAEADPDNFDPGNVDDFGDWKYEFFSEKAQEVWTVEKGLSPADAGLALDDPNYWTWESEEIAKHIPRMIDPEDVSGPTQRDRVETLWTNAVDPEGTGARRIERASDIVHNPEDFGYSIEAGEDLGNWFTDPEWKKIQASLDPDYYPGSTDAESNFPYLYLKETFEREDGNFLHMMQESFREEFGDYIYVKRGNLLNWVKKGEVDPIRGQAWFLEPGRVTNVSILPDWMKGSVPAAPPLPTWDEALDVGINAVDNDLAVDFLQHADLDRRAHSAWWRDETIVDSGDSFPYWRLKEDLSEAERIFWTDILGSVKEGHIKTQLWGDAGRAHFGEDYFDASVVVLEDLLKKRNLQRVDMSTVFANLKAVMTEDGTWKPAYDVFLDLATDDETASIPFRVLFAVDDSYMEGLDLVSPTELSRMADDPLNFGEQGRILSEIIDDTVGLDEWHLRTTYRGLHEDDFDKVEDGIYYSAKIPVENLRGLGAVGEGEIFIEIPNPADFTMEGMHSDLFERYNIIDDETAMLGRRQDNLTQELADLDELQAELQTQLADMAPLPGGEPAPFYEDLVTQAEAARGETIDQARIASEMDRIKTWAGNRHYRYQEAVEQGGVRAVDMAVEFIDDHRFRSQFQQTVRNIMPFWFAEEQFIKRAARTVIDSPEAIARMNLLMNFGRSSGLFQTDNQGNEIIAYPGTQYLTEGFYRNLGLVFGYDGLDAFAEPLSHRLEFTFAGANGQLVQNPFGPVVGLLTAGLAETFPELEPVDRNGWIQNEVAQGKSWYEHLFPTAVTRMITAFAPETVSLGGQQIFSNDTYSSAAADTVRLLHAAGHMPGEDATPLEREEFRDRVRNITRINAVVNVGMYLGSPLPSGNKFILNDPDVSQEFKDTVFGSGLPYELGTALYYERNPDATVWTVFDTVGTTGARIPQNAATYQWLREHNSLVEQYPLGAVWFLPTPLNGYHGEEAEEENKWSQRAADEMMKLGLSERHSPDALMEEIYYVSAARDFYPRQEEYDRQIWLARQANNQAQVKYFEEQKATWKEQFLNQHPVFKDLTQPVGRNTERRQDAKVQRDALLDMDRGQLPDDPFVDVMLNYMQNHRHFNRMMESFKGNSTEVSDVRKQTRYNFLMWAAQEAKNDPRLEGYFDANIRWDSDVASGGSAMIFEIEQLTGSDL